MKILYILGAYKPNMSANGVCSDKVITKLLEDGHAVTVLCNAAKGYACEREENGARIVTVKQRLFLRISEKSVLLATEKPVLSKMFKLLAIALNKIQLFVTMPTWPKISFSTMKRFEKAALKLQQEENFDAVVAVYAPVEALLAGAAMKQKYPQVKFYPYFLDSLSGGYGPRLFSKKMTFKAGLKIEKKVFPLADKIVIMNSAKEHQLKHNSEFKEKLAVLDIPMFTPFEAAERENREIKRLLYIGSIPFAMRNPDPLIDVLSSLADQSVEIEFVGNIDCIDRFKKLKELFGERLTFTENIPHEQVADKIHSADVLLNIGNSNSAMVPSKIFEYMSYGKPILSTYTIDDEPSLEYLKKYPSALMVDARAEFEKKEIVDFVFGAKEIDPKALSDKFYANTPKAFSKEIIEN